METQRRWDDEQILAFASTGTILLRDASSKQVPMSPWLEAHADRFDLATAGWPPQLVSYVQADRLVALKAFMESSERPNEIVEYVARWRDGSGWRQLRSRRVNLFDDDRVGAMLVTFVDEGPAQVDSEPEQVPGSALSESQPWVIQHLDHTGNIIDAEGMVEELTGRTAKELVGTWALDLIDPSVRADIVIMWMELMQRPGEVRTVQLRLFRPDTAEPRWVEVAFINRTGAVQHDGSVLAVFHDVSEKRARHEAQQSALHHRAEHDALTSVLNRSALDACLEDAVAAGSEDLLVLFLDLDGFKAINDTFGHDAGDAVLQAVAGRLRGAVRPSDDVGRYGGDEFVAVCGGVAPSAQDALVRRVAAALEPPVEWEGGRWVPQVSIGVARHRAGETVSSLLRRADAAMFEQKGERRRCSP